MTIREFESKDQRQIKELITDILSKEFFIDQQAYPYYDLDSIERVYGGERESFFVCEENGRISGTIAVKEESKKTAILRRFFVMTDCRGRGYGRLLIDSALEFCKQKNYSEVIFHVSNAMKSATELCVKKGFHEKQRLDLGGVKIIKFSLTL
ncbi:MAG: GNAT family N-acetyltransferase [Candidatus Omnitrophota bacterium]